MQAAEPSAFGHAAVAERARTSVIVPGYETFGRRLDTLAMAFEKLCATPSDAALAAARQAFSETVSAWGRIEFINFGPIANDNRLERIFFWPDRKSIGRRQVEELLAGQDATATDPVKLASKSVAVQGLTALELVLYGDGASSLAVPPLGGYRCRYARAIVGNLDRIITDVLRGWSDSGGFQRLWSAPGMDNPVYLRPRETTGELVGAIDQMLNVVREHRVRPVIGFGRTRRRVRPVLWRSKLGMVLIHANLEGVRDLMRESGLIDQSIATSARPEQMRGALDSMLDEYVLMIRASGELAASPDPFARGDIKSRLVALGFPLKDIRQKAVALIKQAADLSVGFNANDGD